MNAYQRRQYEMLLRVRDFGNTNRELFSSSTVAQEAFASIGTAIDELTTTDLLKLSASVSARADRKAIARKALVDLLLKISQIVRVLEANGQTMPALELPASRSDQMLLTAARQFAQDAAPFEAVLIAHGVEPKVIPEVAARFEAATRDRGMKRADHTAAAAKIRDLVAAAILKVRRLDLIVDSELVADKGLRAAWEQARRIENPRAARRGTAGVEVPAAATPAETPAPAKVTETPSSEAA
jgi:hypothetical protein